jgi:hypothetical protein
MATYQIINLQTGEFQTVSLDEAARIASLDPHEIEWAIEEHGVCETDQFQIIELDRNLPEDGERDGGDAKNKFLTPVFVFISREEFEAHLAQSPAAVIRLRWDEPIVRHAVEGDRERVMAELGSEAEPSGVFHLTRESIALIR